MDRDGYPTVAIDDTARQCGLGREHWRCNRLSSRAPSIVGTFDFAYVGFAVLWGAVFFSEAPDLITMAGIVLIVLAGLLATRR